jgi:FPC/CPF motif-containing protein YcgG
MECASDAVKALGRIIGAVRDGEISPREAADIASLITTFARATDIAVLEARLSDIERRLQKEQRGGGDEKITTDYARASGKVALAPGEANGERGANSICARPRGTRRARERAEPKLAT